MRSSTLTSKGQVTIPKKIRDFLKLKTGDLIDFIIDRQGNVVVRAGTVHVGELKGLLRRSDRKPVSLGEMDRAILRLGTYELLHRPDVPPKVAIDEAIRLAKKFSTAESGAFVNGILDKIMTARTGVHGCGSR